MSHRHLKASGNEPGLGGRQALTGMEPALSREFELPYGRFRMKGLEAPQVATRRRPLVVLADSNPDATLLVPLVAESNGYQVKQTGSGSEAWGLLRAFVPDMLVISPHLIGMGPLELIQHVRTDEKDGLQALPVLMMGFHNQQLLMSTFEGGVDDYLGTPYGPGAMLRCWRRLLLSCQRPSPLAALQSEDSLVRQTALSFLLARHPEGLVDGLSSYLWHPDPVVSGAAYWALQRLGTPQALAALEAGQRRVPSSKL